MATRVTDAHSAASLGAMPRRGAAVATTSYLAGTIELAPGVRRHCHRWMPCIDPREVRHACVLVHGLGDHGGRYEAIGRALSADGVSLQAIDLIGHGRSPGRRGRIESFESLLSEIDGSLRAAKSLWPFASLTLIGQSMGGNLAASAAMAWFAESRVDEDADDVPRDVLPFPGLRGKPLADRLVLVAPMLRPPGKQLREDFLEAGVKLAKLLPGWPLRTGGRPERLSPDPDAQAAHRGDRLIHHTLSVQLGIELLLAGRRLLSDFASVPLPTLVLYGQEDTLIDHASLGEFASQNSSIRCQAIQGARHEPLQDSSREAVLAALRAGFNNGVINGVSGSLAAARKRRAS